MTHVCVLGDALFGNRTFSVSSFWLRCGFSAAGGASYAHSVICNSAHPTRAAAVQNVCKEAQFPEQITVVDNFLTYMSGIDNAGNWVDPYKEKFTRPAPPAPPAPPPPPLPLSGTSYTAASAPSAALQCASAPGAAGWPPAASCRLPV